LCIFGQGVGIGSKYPAITMYYNLWMPHILKPSKLHLGLIKMHIWTIINNGQGVGKINLTFNGFFLLSKNTESIK
jgi:hypothetical protein